MSRKHKGKDFESEARTFLSSDFSTPGEITISSNQSEPVAGSSADFMLTDYIEPTGVNDEGEGNDHSLIQGQQCNSDRLQRSAALLLLTAKECYQLIQSALDFIVHQIQQMISFAVDDIDEMVTQCLTSQGTLESIPELKTYLEAMCNP